MSIGILGRFQENSSLVLNSLIGLVDERVQLPGVRSPIVEDITKASAYTLGSMIGLKVLSAAIAGSWTIPLVLGVGYAVVVLSLDTDGEGRKAVNAFLRTMIGLPVSVCNVNQSCHDSAHDLSKSQSNVTLSEILCKMKSNFYANLQSIKNASLSSEAQELKINVRNGILFALVGSVACVALPMFCGIMQGVVVLVGAAYVATALCADEGQRSGINVRIADVFKEVQNFLCLHRV